MSATLEERIQKQIQKLEKDREEFLIKVNQEIVAYQSAIAELKKLLEPEPENVTLGLPETAASPVPLDKLPVPAEPGQ